jgi:hypothetical protein
VPINNVPFGAYLSDEDQYVWVIGGALDSFTVVKVNVGILSLEYHSLSPH